MVKKRDTDTSKQNSPHRNEPDASPEKAKALPVSNYTPVSVKLVGLIIDRLLLRYYIGGVKWDHMFNLYHDVYKGVGRTNGYAGYRSTEFEITGEIKRWFRTHKYNMGHIYLDHNDDDTINKITVNIHGTCAKNRRFAQDIKDLFPTVEVELKSTADSASKV